MKKFFKGVSTVLAMTLAMGIFAGCTSKVKTVTYDYDAAEYIKIGNYKGIEVEMDDYTVTDEDVQDIIKQLREKYMEYQIVDRAAQEGDMVVVTFDAYISGGKVEGFSSADYQVIIGSDEFIIDGFEDALIGLGAGEKRAITGLKVPDDFAGEASYAGRAITFNIDIAGVYEPVLPTYDDAFVTEVSLGDITTVDDYNAEIKKMLEENAVINRYNDKYNKILDAIVADSEVLKDFPAEYVESKMASIQEEVNRFTVLYSMTEEEYMSQYYGVNSIEEAAKNQIMLEFIFQQIIVEEKLSVTEKYYEEHLEEAAEKRNYSTVEKFVNFFTEEGVVKCMLLDQATDLIMESAVEK